MVSEAVRAQLRTAAPFLSRKLDTLVSGWTRRLEDKLNQEDTEFRSKQVNDPIWGTIELLPWEVALLDTDLLQRMRGVRQLGLAQLVFPGACHDRLEHILGVIGAVEVTLNALSRQIERRNRDKVGAPLPVISEDDRYSLRLAALFHDLGHGPFSHATELVMEQTSVLRSSDPASAEAAPLEDDWRGDIERVRVELLRLYQYNSEPPVSEILAVMIVLSEPITEILKAKALGLPGTIKMPALQNRLVAAITGAADGPGTDHLTAVISGQIDADKLDYLQRDAHHAGLEIGFDTDRLLSRLEILQVREENLDGSAIDLRKRAAKAPHNTLLQLGIAASGFGSFEQMLIGRTFLYDRLYHHHKVRAAEAMAQRLILVAERDRSTRFALEDLFMNFADDTVLRLFAGQVQHAAFEAPAGPTQALAQGILSRDLLHRAFALRGRFIGVAPELDAKAGDDRRRALWLRVVEDLKTLRARYEMGQRIYQLALTCTDALIANGVDASWMGQMRERLLETGPEQIIVDLSSLKADGIRILARYPNGALRVPEFSFNPFKWTNAYELQKRTSYVFCPREVVAIVSLAAKLEFFKRYGVVLAREADGFIKADRQIGAGWIDALERAGLVDGSAKRYLTETRISLISIQSVDLRVPADWLQVDEDFGVTLAQKLNQALPGGIAIEQMDALSKTLELMWRLIDTWHTGAHITATWSSEAELQKWVADQLRAGGVDVREGTRGSGGISDLIIDDMVIVENKFSGTSSAPVETKPAAGMQGRRYAIALDRQIVLVVHAYQVAGSVPDKTASVTVHRVSDGDRHAEIRIDLPYGAPVPSREVQDPARST